MSKEKKLSGMVRVSEELLSEIRKRQAPYLGRGLKPPEQGEFVQEAWAKAERWRALDDVDKGDQEIVALVAEILKSGHGLSKIIRDSAATFRKLRDVVPKGHRPVAKNE